MMKSESHYFATPNKIIDSMKTVKWMEPLDERTMMDFTRKLLQAIIT